MPRSVQRRPKYRHYKPKDLAVVRIAGVDRYLGKYGSQQSLEKYHLLIAEFYAGSQAKPGAIGSATEPTVRPLTIDEVLLAYLRFVDTYYVRDGMPTSEAANVRDALRPLRRLYGSTQADQFGPLALKLIRQHMIDVQNLCRTEINKRIGRIKRMFAWAVSEELIPAGVTHALATIKGLYHGRTTARESEPIKPVPDSWVNAVLPYLPPQVVGMIELQRVTGMRPGEVVLIRACDIDMTQPVWVYTVTRHKNDWRGHSRLVAIGPRGQDILRPFLDRALTAPLFSPQEAQQWRLAHRQICYPRSARKTMVYPSELRRRAKVKTLRRGRLRQRPVGDHYTTRSYWRALDYGIKRAAQAGVIVPGWFPNQLRHSRATELRKKYGIEATRVSLGHAHLTATEIYAEKNVALAIHIAREAG